MNDLSDLVGCSIGCLSLFAVSLFSLAAASAVICLVLKMFGVI